MNGTYIPIALQEYIVHRVMPLLTVALAIIASLACLFGPFFLHWRGRGAGATWRQESVR